MKTTDTHGHKIYFDHTRRLGLNATYGRWALGTCLTSHHLLNRKASLGNWRAFLALQNIWELVAEVSFPSGEFVS